MLKENRTGWRQKILTRVEMIDRRIPREQQKMQSGMAFWRWTGVSGRNCVDFFSHREHLEGFQRRHLESNWNTTWRHFINLIKLRLREKISNQCKNIQICSTIIKFQRNTSSNRRLGAIWRHFMSRRLLITEFLMQTLTLQPKSCGLLIEKANKCIKTTLFLSRTQAIR